MSVQINEFKTKVKHLYGFYRAKVVDNKDPLFFGRVKIWIPDIFVDIPETEGLWARPANNPIGGRNDKMDDEGKKRYGTLYIPEVSSWVWVFFEGGNVNRPYYWSALDIENTLVPPENRVGQEYQEKWTIFRSKQGRVILVSDDPYDERIEITGKKSSIEDVYTIEGNQKTILIDERRGKEKILIKDQNGNYINIDTINNTINIYSINDTKQKVGQSYSIIVEGDMKIKVSGNLSYEVDGQIHIKASDICRIQSKHLHLQEGASPQSPDEPTGSRD